MNFKITQLDSKDIIIEEKEISFSNDDDKFLFEITKTEKKDEHPVYYLMPVKGRIKPVSKNMSTETNDMNLIEAFLGRPDDFNADVKINEIEIIVTLKARILEKDLLYTIEKICNGFDYYIMDGGALYQLCVKRNIKEIFDVDDN
jgi:hypothetical protein